MKEPNRGSTGVERIRVRDRVRIPNKTDRRVCEVLMNANGEAKMLGAALAYRRAGLCVLPVNGKIPKIGDWPDKATLLEDQIRDWWQQWPTANIGILTGESSGVVVLDIDGPEGATSLSNLVAEHGGLPHTPTVTTGRGTHFYFKYPGCRIPSRSRVGGHKGLDVRGDGGFVVAPPSRHSSGSIYEWQGREHEFAELPGWLFDLMVATSVPIVKPQTSDASSSVGEEITEGSRNETLFKQACRLRAAGKRKKKSGWILSR